MCWSRASLLTSAVNIPSLYGRLIRVFNNAPGLPNQGSDSPRWLCISPTSTCSRGPVPTHKARQTFSHLLPQRMPQPQPHATLNDTWTLRSYFFFKFLLFSTSFLKKCFFFFSTEPCSYTANLKHTFKAPGTAGGLFNLHHARWHWQKGEESGICLHGGNGIESAEKCILSRSLTGHILTCN